MIDNMPTKFKYLVKRRKLLKRTIVNYMMLALGKKPLRTVHIATGWACNVKCPHCYAAPFVEDKREILPLEKWEKIVADCVSEGALNFVFQGGEPLMSEYTEPLIGIINGKGACPVVNTNGVLLAEKAGSLKKAGLEWLNVSFNIFGESHDEFYGVPGLFDRTVEGIDISREAGLNVIAVTIVTNDSLETGETLKLALFLRERGIDTWLVYPMPTGRWHGNDDIRLKQENLAELDKLLEKSFIHWEGEGNYYKFGCPAGAETIYISAYGDVTPCASMNISFGNIVEEPLKDILKKMREHEYFNGIQPRCVASVDDDFIKDYIQPLEGREGCVPSEEIRRGTSKRDRDA